MSEQTKELDIVERARERAWAEPEPNDLTRLLSALIEEIDRLRAGRPGWREGWEAAREEAAKVADARQAKWAATPTQGKQNAIMMEALEIEAILIAKAIRALHPSVAEGRGDEKNNSVDAAASPIDHATKR